MALFGQQLTLSPPLSPPRSPDLPGDLENAAAAAAAAPAPVVRSAISLDNVLKLIPGDAVSLFITGAGLTTAVTLNGWTAICFWVCFAVCAVVRIVATRPAGETGLSIKGVNWSLTGATLLAFFIWAHAVSAVGPVIPAFHGPAAGFFAMVLGVVAPLFVRAA